MNKESGSCLARLNHSSVICVSLFIKIEECIPEMVRCRVVQMRGEDSAAALQAEHT